MSTTPSTPSTSASTSKHLATLTASDAGFQRLLRDAVLADRGVYENALLTIMDGELNVLASGAGTALSYATFTTGPSATFQTIAVEESVTSTTPDDEPPLVEALLDIATFRGYYDLVRDLGQSVSLAFFGAPDNRLASYVEMYGEGGLNARLHLPVSETILRKMPLSAPTKFDDDNVWDGNVRLDTEIQTSANRVRRIIDAVDADEISTIDNYPVVVEDGTFQLNVTDDTQRNWISGTIADESTVVSGDDVANLYGSGFADIFQTLDGSVRLQTTAVEGNSGAPLAVVQGESGGSGVVRHVIGSCGTL